MTVNIRIVRLLEELQVLCIEQGHMAARNKISTKDTHALEKLPQHSRRCVVLAKIVQEFNKRIVDVGSH